jgi:hypothetical protein
MPIVAAVVDILEHRSTVATAIETLMTRPFKAEW